MTEHDIYLILGTLVAVLALFGLWRLLAKKPSPSALDSKPTSTTTSSSLQEPAQTVPLKAPPTFEKSASRPAAPLPSTKIPLSEPRTTATLVAPAPLAETPAPPSPVSSTPISQTATTAATATIPALPSDITEIKATTTASWLSKLRSGLTRSRDQLTSSLSTLFAKNRVFDDRLLDEIHEILFRSDLGVQTTDSLVGGLRKKFSSSTEEIGWDRIREALREEMTVMLAQGQTPLAAPTSGPLVLLVVGVNGVGKTTSIGKLAAHFSAQGKSVLLCAADTFRAAAIEQLSVWGDRLGLEVIKHQAGSDPAAVAYDAVKAAIARNYDVLLIDTAGRLHSKTELMDELAKIKKVIGRDLPGAPHEVWLVLDATTGQNAIQQVKTFREVVDITGLVVTKLDGTAKGGVVVSIINQYKLPLRYIGVGEKAADLRSFQPAEFAQSIL